MSGEKSTSGQSGEGYPEQPIQEPPSSSRQGNEARISSEEPGGVRASLRRLLRFSRAGRDALGWSRWGGTLWPRADYRRAGYLRIIPVDWPSSWRRTDLARASTKRLS